VAKPGPEGSEGDVLAEEEGFEPPVPFGTMVFKTIALNHSATPPLWLKFSSGVEVGF
jgi:hypothetical protein